MDFVRELKKRGYRITNPREVICSILENSGHEHFTVEKLHQLSTKKDKNIDLATVYRTLELLESIDRKNIKELRDFTLEIINLDLEGEKKC